MANVTPELLADCKQYLDNRSRGESASLLLFFRQIFGRDINLKCGACIEQAAIDLRLFINRKQNTMQNFKWVGGNATCIIKVAGQTTQVGKNNCNDRLAEIIYSNAKYGHLVEKVGGVRVDLQPKELELKDGEVIVKVPAAEDGEDAPKLEISEVTTSTLTEAKTEEPKPKRKYEKRK